MQAPRYAGIRDYFAVLRRNVLLIIVTTVVAGAVAFAVAGRPAPRYTATASITYQEETRDLAYLGASASQSTPVDNSASVQARTIATPPVVAEVRRTLGTRLTDADLLAPIDIQTDVNSPVVYVVATSSDGAFAARLVNAFVTSAQKVTNLNSRTRLMRLARRIRLRLDGLNDDATGQALRGQLSQQLAAIEYLTTSSRPARLVDLARGSQLVESDRRRKVGIGLLLGLAIGLVGAFLRDILDRRLYGLGVIERELDLPMIGRTRSKVLGRVLWPSDASDGGLAQDVESFQIMRRNLEQLGEDAPRTVVVTSTVPGEGKSSVAASLAAAAAGAGRRTVLVECDLRKPSLAGRLDVLPSPGLSDYLHGDADLAIVVQAVERGDAIPSSIATANGNSRRLAAALDCITAGSPTLQPTVLLGSDGFRSLLEQLSSDYDLVVLDTSPLLPVADTLELLALADSIVLCIRSGQTTREQALAGKTVIAHYPSRPTGVVVTGLRPRDEPGYGHLGGYAGDPR